IQINCGFWRYNVKWNSVMLCKYGKIVSSDLVGKISIYGNAVGTDKDFLNFTLDHDRGRHVIANESEWDFTLAELPGCESCTLIKRPRFIDKNVNVFLISMGLRNHTKSRANTHCG